MVRINIDPVLAHLGPIAISWYGLAVMAALAAGMWLTVREARRRQLPDGRFSDIAIWVVLGGVVGARLLHVLDHWHYYAAEPMRILAVQNGGLAILGAILGGSLAGAVAARRAGLPLLKSFDVVAPGLVLGQAIGRLGCLVTGDTVGRPTDGSWGVMYLHPGAMVPQRGVAYQPVFLYEMLWDLLVFAVLWRVRTRITTDGWLFALYLGLYAAGKFALTFLRTETVWLWGLQEAQLLALGAFAVAVLWALWSRTLQRRAQTVMLRA